MKVLMLMVLFNIHTGAFGNYKIEKVFPKDDWLDCSKALLATGPQKPDKDGYIKLYGCQAQGDRPQVNLVYR